MKAALQVGQQPTEVLCANPVGAVQLDPQRLFATTGLEQDPKRIAQLLVVAFGGWLTIVGVVGAAGGRGKVRPDEASTRDVPVNQARAGHVLYVEVELGRRQLTTVGDFCIEGPKQNKVVNAESLGAALSCVSRTRSHPSGRRRVPGRWDECHVRQ